MPTVPSIVFMLLVASCTAFAAQFRADGFAVPWPSADGAASLVAANAATNDWVNPALSGGGVSFAATTNGVPTPLWFGDGATGTVAYVALVVDCMDAPAAWSTLLDAPSALRAEPAPYSWQCPAFSTSGVSIAVDGSACETIPPDGAKHLVEVSFDDAVALSELSLGGHPATPAWNRSWTGRIYEAVFLEAAPQGESANALCAYLSLKWDLGLDVAAPLNARDTLLLLGVKTDPMFSSIIIAR